MLSYEDILKNDYIKEQYSRIEQVNPFPFDHGLKHVTNVCRIMDRLCGVINVSPEEKSALLIACAAHDVGQADGRQDHGLKARSIIEKEFGEELKDIPYFHEILESVENHDEKCSERFPLFTTLVQFADKMDFTKERLADGYKEKFEYQVWEDVEEVEFILDEEYFGINIRTHEVENIVYEIMCKNFTAKIINAVKTLAKKLGLRHIIKVNNKIIDTSNYIILHGSFGSKDGNWFPWLCNELQKRKLIVAVPQMPVGVNRQNYDSWALELDKLKVDEETTLIAHSIAPVFVCKYLIKNQIKVRKLIFVCGFNNYVGINEEYDSVNKPMFVDNLGEVRKYCDNIVCYYSDNDPYVPMSIEKKFADEIGGKQIIIKDGGHINSETGYDHFEEILDELK